MRQSNLSIHKRRSSRRRGRVARPSWLWRWHHLLSGFVVFFGVGMAIASLQYGTVKYDVAHASVTDDLYGFFWADPIGWSSANSANAMVCSGSCGSYGLNLDTNPSSPTYRQINGFAWNDSAGWICFGSSCAAAAGSCSTIPPTGNPADMKVTVDPVGSPAPGTVDVHGWADVCNEGDAGWISLNCNDIAGCGVYPWRVKFAAAPGTYQGYFGNPAPPPNLESYGWNGASGGVGFGYFDFSKMYLNNPENTPAACGDGYDNDLNGKIDCADPSCAGITNSKGVTCALTEAGHCTDGVDNDGNGFIDCQDSACGSDSSCIASKGEGAGLPATTDALGRPGTAANFCSDGVDNDGNGLIDCADPKCAAVPSCIAALGEGTGLGLATDALGRPPTRDNFCSDGVDNNGNGLTDCADPSCSAATPCLPVWLQAKYGNIYAQQGITGAAATSSVGTYCLSSNGNITGFSSQSGCTEPASNSLTLPKSGTGYQGSLGSLDVTGILSGRYGAVVAIPNVVTLPAVLDGKVYHVTGDATIDATTLQNGSGTTRGNGLLFVDGGNLTIVGNIGYLAESLPTSIRNIASLGVIVRKNPVTGVGGDLFIQSTVGTVSGAYFVEGTVHTGTSGATDLTPLQVVGLMAAHQFSLERQYHSASQAAETFVFDGRAFANPPPGMSEVGKSLPASRDAF